MRYLLAIIALLITFPHVAFSQTVTTNNNCYLITDKYPLQSILGLQIENTMVAIIPKGETVKVIEIDKESYKYIRVQYKDKTGWIHRNMIIDRSLLIDGNPKVRSEYINRIKQHKISRRMNREELELSIGNLKESNINKRLLNKSFMVSADIGYTIKNYIAINAAISRGVWYYGFSAQLNVSTGEKGKSYDKIINWDNNLDGVSDSGKYYLGAFGFDLGYYFMENLCIGVGLGYAPHKLYRNFYDNTHILHESGWYHVSKEDGGRVDAKAFIRYFFKQNIIGGRFYIGGQYSLTGSAGINIGYQFGSN